MDERVLVSGDYAFWVRQACVLGPDRRRYRLSPKAALLLEYFLTHPNQALSHQSLLHHGWPGRVVSDSALRRVVADIRRAFDDDYRAPLYLKTCQTQGYQWLQLPHEEYHAPLGRDRGRWRLALGAVTVAMVSAAALWSLELDESGQSVGSGGRGARAGLVPKAVDNGYWLPGQWRQQVEAEYSYRIDTPLRSGECIDGRVAPNSVVIPLRHRF
ncbi:Transcriptional regulatory protein, C terminal [Ferrimonas sediminum]|uniref:Transcriptional regulatory protein, C terminal n=1 Tax=Ferrimonas sediminum TaxID=718193 RepID=A0A1G8JUN6_9GAMM|nr:winged helix-turn-helix domain-containing protein [Ferrimonas sediminum]SDI34320.1 Transcriptional regulatory protein, C terminal [Ferrimonas sediminum]